MTKTAKGGWIAAALAATVIATPGLAAGDFHRHNPYCGHGSPGYGMQHRFRDDDRGRGHGFGRGRGFAFGHRKIPVCAEKRGRTITLFLPIPAALKVLRSGGPFGPCDVSPHK